MVTGRPTEYSEAVCDEICTRLMEGESLKSITYDDHLPARSTIFLWLIKHKEFSDKYIRARSIQADTYADEIADIADDSTNDYMEKRLNNGDTVEVFNHENVKRSQLRIATRQWIAERNKPNKYFKPDLPKDDDEIPVIKVQIEALNGRKTESDDSAT